MINNNVTNTNNNLLASVKKPMADIVNDSLYNISVINDLDEKVSRGKASKSEVADYNNAEAALKAMHISDDTIALLSRFNPDRTPDRSAILGMLSIMKPLTDSIAFDEDTKDVVFKNPVKLSQRITLPSGIFDEVNHVLQLEGWLAGMHFNPKKSELIDAMTTVAKHNQYHHNREIIDDMIAKGHYDENIYKKIMVDWLGARDEAYTYHIIKSMLVAAYRQQHYDGPMQGFHSTPMRVTIYGKQGIGKSLLLDAIAGSSSYEPSISRFKQPDDRDNMMGYSSNILVNLDDVGYAGSVSSVDAIKSLITAATLTYRKPYGHSNITTLNRAVWVGSTNRQYTFSDTTGDRREYPLEVAVGMDADESIRHGRFGFETLLQHGQDMQPIYDLWATVYHDCIVSGDFNPILAPGDTLWDDRVNYVAKHQRPNFSKSMIADLLALEVPNTFHLLNKQQQVSVLTVLVDEPKTPYHKLVSLAKLDYSFKKPLGKFHRIPATVIRQVVDRKTEDKTVPSQQIHEEMAQRGWSLKSRQWYINTDNPKD